MQILNATCAFALALSTTAAAKDAADKPQTPAAMLVLGEAAAYGPLLSFPIGDLLIEAPISLSGRLESTSAYVLDRDGNRLSDRATLSPRARVGLTLSSDQAYESVRLDAIYEHDLPTGTATAERALAGQDLPGDRNITTAIRKLYGQAIIGNVVNFTAGLQTSHWGLGLLANDGAHGWEPGSARFSDPRDGDRVLRGRLGTGPHTDLGLVVAGAIDVVWDDDSLLTEEELEGVTQPHGATGGEEAFQYVAAVMLGFKQPTGGGVYFVRREQTTDDGRRFDVFAIDLNARTAFELGGANLKLETELALITGETTLGASADVPVHDVLQLGAAVRANLDFGGDLGVAFDFLYASGDQNLDDDTQHGFRTDVNYDMGMLLYDQILAGQSGRAYGTAGDPNLVGQPAQGLERAPTRGAITNSIAFFPRLWWRPVAGLEAYGGPLIALSEVPLLDPLNTRLNGGGVRNALDGVPGSYYGTEIDLGVRYRALLWGTEVTLGAEGAAFFPGGAFTDAAGQTPGTVWGGRFMIDYRL